MNEEEITIELINELGEVSKRYIEEIGAEEFYGIAITFMTYGLYESGKNHSESFKILRRAMDRGILNYMNYKEH